MRRFMHVAVFAFITLVSAVILAAVAYQFAAVRERLADASPALGSTAVPFLVDGLEDEDNVVQVRSALALRKIGPDAVAVLVDSLNEPCSNTRRKAALALGIIGDASAVAALSQMVRAETDRETRLTAIRALQMMGPRACGAVSPLLEAFASPDAEIRAVAGDTLGLVGIGDQDVIAALVAALDDDDAQVRRLAAHALGRMQAKEAAIALERATGDPDRTVAATAALSLQLLPLDVALRANP